MSLHIVVLFLIAAFSTRAQTSERLSRSGNWVVRHVVLDSLDADAIVEALQRMNRLGGAIEVTRAFASEDDMRDYLPFTTTGLVFPERDLRPNKYQHRIEAIELIGKKGPLAEYIRLRNQHVLRVRESGDQRMTIQPLLHIRAEGLEFEVIEIGAERLPLSQRKHPDDMMIITYLRSDSVGREQAMAAYRAVKRLAGDSFVRVYLRRDLWFVSIAGFPIHSLSLMNAPRAPSWNEWQKLESVMCEGFGEDPQSCR